MKLASAAGVLAAAILTVTLATPAAAATTWHDATNGELLDTGWPVSDVRAVGWAHAGRAAHEWCGARGYLGGRLNGHQRANVKGITCVGGGTSQWFDVTTGQLLDAGTPVADVNGVPWSHAAVAANQFCRARGFVGGFLNGHQRANVRGAICLSAADAQWFDATTGQLLDTGAPVGDVRRAGWAHAAVAGYEFCRARGFVGGFLNGHSAGNLRGTVCLK
ncbi:MULTISPECIES: hypothetical protein [Catenuloplanes]|uniref:Uncharacterized protein n=1 Tax=Catenuloplanes niger TaxID=587534 RepID=A0AAE4D0C3_9ACTN|nr:hypothetical protein [Catenuloplanes niger]MDR7327779.1 hypothetical protein [Catenuloplanes niger]